MEDAEAYLRAMAAPLASAQEGRPLPVVRFGLAAVANAFVILGLLPAARAEEILAAQRPLLTAAGFRVGREGGELSVSPDARGFQEARAAGADSPQKIPLAVGAGPVRCRLRGHDLVITWATLTRGDRGGDHGSADHRRHRPNVPGASGERALPHVRAVFGVRRDALDPRRRVPRRARPPGGRPPRRRPAGRPVA